jgi:hypothetical protein
MAKTKAATPLVPTKVAEDLTRRYIDSLRKLQGSVQKKVETVARGLSASPAQLQTRVRNDSMELINAYIDSLRNALGQSDSALRTEQAIRDYILGVQKLSEDTNKDLAEAVRDYAATIRDLPADVQKGIQEAYAAYAASLDEALGEMDIAGASPDEILALGQSLTTVALYTRAALGR